MGLTSLWGRFRFVRILGKCATATAIAGAALTTTRMPAGATTPVPPPTFNVKSYGAHGDAKGDNSLAFHKAIAAAQTHGGGIVYVPAGTYTFSTGAPASISIGGTVPITLAGASRDTTVLRETTAKKDLLSVHLDGAVIQDVTLDTQTNQGGHALGVGASNTTVQRIRALSGTRTFGVYYPGPAGAHPGDGQHDTGNVVNDLILNDQLTGDGWSFSFQDQASISNVVHTGSRISLYADTNTTITNYNYTPGNFGATAGWVISTPCDNITINNFVSSGQGGQIRNAPDSSRINQDITINGEQMTGGPTFRLLLGDVQNLLVENSSLDGITISPQFVAQGTVTSTTYTGVAVHKLGGSDQIVFS